MGGLPGFFISKLNILSNYHVIKDCDVLVIRNNKFKEIAKPIAISEEYDLAVLKLVETHQEHDVARFRSGRSIRSGEQIVALGFPLGQTLGSGMKATTGNISSLSGLGGNISSMQITTPIQPGNSGGPVLDKGGNVVGVVAAVYNKKDADIPSQNVNFAIKSTTVQSFLDAKDIGYKVNALKGKKETPDIVDEGRKFTVNLYCLEQQ